MTQRLSSRTLPAAPADWPASSRETWSQLLRVLESSNLFDRGRRTQLQFVVKGTVSAPVTLDMGSPSVTVLTNVVGHLLIALQGSDYLDVRTTVA
jgi:hypothetical protein